jgi:hypothetical protein
VEGATASSSGSYEIGCGGYGSIQLFNYYSYFDITHVKLEKEGTTIILDEDITLKFNSSYANSKTFDNLKNDARYRITVTYTSGTSTSSWIEVKQGKTVPAYFRGSSGWTY